MTKICRFAVSIALMSPCGALAHELAGVDQTASSTPWELLAPEAVPAASEFFADQTATAGFPDAVFQDDAPIGHQPQAAGGPGLESSPSSRPALITASSPTTAAAATRPESTSAAAGHFPDIGGTFGLREFVDHFAPHEPMYFVGGTKAPNIKFQFSLRYRILNPEGPLASQYDWLKGFNFAYSQTSLWDFSNPDQPFFYDSSYRPELFYYLESLPYVQVPQNCQAGLQAGVGHESNGLKDPDHRSLNIIYFRPILTLGAPSDDLFVTVAPKFYYYIAGLSLNPDLPKYRGYCDMRVVVGQRDGLQLATIGRLGSDFNKGSAQFDLTYPLTKILGGNVDIALDAQYFVGYGDTLLTYNHYSNIFRIGLAIVR